MNHTKYFDYSTAAGMIRTSEYKTRWHPNCKLKHKQNEMNDGFVMPILTFESASSSS